MHNTRRAMMEAGFERLQPELRGWLLRQLRDPDVADDLLQMTMLKAQAAADRFHGDADRIRPWVFTIARNALRDYFRKKQPIVDAEVTDDAVAKMPAPLQSLLNQELATWLATAEADLSPKLATCFRLRVRDGMSFAAMAHELNEPADRLMGRTYLALKQLRAAYLRRFGDD